MPSAGAPSLEKLATAVGWRDGRIRSFLNAAYGKPRTRRRCPSVRRTASMYATVSSFRRRGSLPGPATYGRLLDDACTLSDPSLFRAILRDVQEAGLPLTPDMLFQCMRHFDRHGDAARVVAYLNAYHSRGLALTQDVLSIVLRSLSAGSDFPGTAALFQQLSLRRAVDWACLVESCSLVPHALSLVALQQLDSGSNPQSRLSAATTLAVIRVCSKAANLVVPLRLLRELYGGEQIDGRSVQMIITIACDTRRPAVGIAAYHAVWPEYNESTVHAEALAAASAVGPEAFEEVLAVATAAAPSLCARFWMQALQHAALHADVGLARRAATPLTQLVRPTTPDLWLRKQALLKRVFAPPPATEAPAFESQIGEGVQDSLPPIAW